MKSRLIPLNGNRESVMPWYLMITTTASDTLATISRAMLGHEVEHLRNSYWTHFESLCRVLLITVKTWRDQVANAKAKLRGWGNWAICQPFKLALFLNFPFLSLSLLHFRSFVLRNASSAKTVFMPSVAAVSYSTHYVAFYSDVLKFESLSRFNHLCSLTLLPWLLQWSIHFAKHIIIS